MAFLTKIKILIVPDGFKGSLSSEEVCECIKASIESASEKHEITTLPFSDGGEGFAKCFKNICFAVCGPEDSANYTVSRDVFS